MTSSTGNDWNGEKKKIRTKETTVFVVLGDRRNKKSVKRKKKVCLIFFQYETHTHTHARIVRYGGRRQKRNKRFRVDTPNVLKRASIQIGRRQSRQDEQVKEQG